MFTRSKIATVVAEFLGTAILVSVAIALTETTAVSYFVGTSVAVTLIVLVLLFGTISGAHFNPAVTFGMWTARLIGSVRAATYIAAQLLGGLAAWQLYEYLTNKDLPAKAQTFDTTIWVAELIGTMILTMGITAAIMRGFDLLETALIVGAALFAGIMVASIASAGYINPAVALGLRSFNAAYVLGPLVGGLLGVNLYAWLFAPQAKLAKRKK